MPEPTKQEYLIFNLTDKLYGVDARLVREIVRLPAVTPMDDAPIFILGVINLRGRVVPVLDLNGRLGRQPQARYLLSDSVIVLEQDGTCLGLIANDIRDVATLEGGDIDAMPTFECFEPRRYRFIHAVARLGEEMVMLLAPEHLLHVYPPERPERPERPEEGQESDLDGAESLSARRHFNAEEGETAQRLFRERARRLMQSAEQHHFKQRISLAVIRLNEEMLGVNLSLVAGFSKVRHVTPIPCCPPHIVGSMNRRGDVLTLVDLSQHIGITTPVGASEKKNTIVIARMGHTEVGVLVHEVVDIVHLHPHEIAAAPTAASILRKEHLQGAIPYRDKMLGVLNIQTILDNPVLLVNEEV